MNVDANDVEQALREKAPEAFNAAERVSQSPITTTYGPHDREALAQRARAYIASMGPSIEGQGGDNHAYVVACRLRDFGLTGSDAVTLMLEWNQTCLPPWPVRDLERFCRSAEKSATGTFGGKLAERVTGTVDTHFAAGTTVVLNGALVLDPSDPLPSARAFVERTHTIDGVVALQHHRGQFYAHDAESGAYREHDESRVRSELYAFLEPAKTPSNAPFKPTKSKVENVLDAVHAVCNLSASVSPPCWLSDDPGLDPLDVLPLHNGLLHIPTRTFLRPNPRFFSLNGLTFAYDPAVPEPSHWLAFLRSVWPDDIETRQALQEWIGYLLTPRTKFQKIAMLCGPKRAGKGTIARVIRRLLGEYNVCGPTLSNMAEPFGLSVLIGKSVAIIADARLSGRADTSVVAERLLAISGEDTLSIARKFLPDWNGKLSTRFMLLTNELPRIEDSSGALASRFLVFRLTESFYDVEDHDLEDRLVPELPGILNWALEGYDRLANRGRFVQPQTSQALIRDFEDLGSPISAFLRDRCDVGAGHEAMQWAVFEAWKTWCHENGREHPGTAQTLGRNLRAVLPWLNTVQHRVVGQPVRYWEGLKLRSEAREAQ